jgi:GNAT superfamily N-acetyltransferase
MDTEDRLKEHDIEHAPEPQTVAQPTEVADSPATAVEALTITRRGPLDSDRAFLAATWTRSYRSSPWAKRIDPEVYYANHANIVNRLLDTEGVVVLCPEEHPTLILGFACGRVYKTAILLHYVYVKKNLRHKGLASFLLESFGWRAGEPKPIIATHWTGLVDYIKAKHPIGHNPYLLHGDFRRRLDVSEAGYKPDVQQGNPRHPQDR